MSVAPAPPVDTAPEKERAPPPAKWRQDPVRVWTIAVVASIAVLLLYSIVADRLTPFTSDARVQAYIVRVAPEVSGRVITIGVRENEYIEAGTLLFEIDPEPFRLAVARDEAALAAAGQGVGASTAAVNTATARLASAIADRDNVRLETARILELVEKEVYAPARGDQASAELQQAEAAVAAAQSELDQAREELGPQGEDNPQIRQALAQLEATRLDLAHTKIFAPSNGVVTNLQLDEGHFASAGQPAMTFIDSELIWVLANMRENSLGNLEVGAHAEVVLDVLPGRIFEARVESVAWGVASGGTDPETGLPEVDAPSEWLLPAQRFPVRLDFTSDRPPRGVRYNARATVVIYTGGNFVMNFLAAAWIRVICLTSYVY